MFGGFVVREGGFFGVGGLRGIFRVCFEIELERWGFGDFMVGKERVEYS